MSPSPQSSPPHGHLPSAAWAQHAGARLAAAGYRGGSARRRVVELLSGETCALTALEIDRRLEGVGRASVYRALEQLESLELVHRFDVGADGAGFERVDPSGDHHHHLVCETCGRLVPFADPGLERAIGAVAAASGFQVSGHEVTLRGRCPACTEANETGLPDAAAELGPNA